MKKALSILLSIAIISVSIFTPMTIIAGATTVNLLRNGDFESPMPYKANTSKGILEETYGLMRGADQYDQGGYVKTDGSGTVTVPKLLATHADFSQWFRATLGNNDQHNAVRQEPGNTSNKVLHWGPNLYQGVVLENSKTYQLSYRTKMADAQNGALNLDKTVNIFFPNETTTSNGATPNSVITSASGTVKDASGNLISGGVNLLYPTTTPQIQAKLPKYVADGWYTTTITFTTASNAFAANNYYAMRMNLNGWGGFSVPNGDGYYMYLDDVTLYEVSTTTFDSQGGSAVAPITAPVGTDLTLTTPTKTGYDFDGWFTAASDGTQVTSPYTTVVGGATLYAQWSQVTTATVTFDSQGGSAVSPVTVNNGDTIATSPTTTQLGYVFDGWYDGSNLVPFPYTVNGDVTLTAHWTNVGTGTVTFDSNGGSSVDPITVTKGEAIASPATTQSGYRFDGWSDGSNIVSFPYTVNGDITLTAQWTVVYAVSATATAGGTVSVSQSSVPAGTNVTFTATVIDPFTFLGWFKNGVLYNTNLEFSEDISADTSYQARFAAPTGQQIVNGDFESGSGYVDLSYGIPERFPSPFYSNPSSWDSAAEYKKWFRASGGNATQYDAIIEDPDNSSNHIAKVMQTALQGVTVTADKTYKLSFKAKSDYAYTGFTVSIADMTHAAGAPGAPDYASSAHPLLFPMTSVIATKTYNNGSGIVTEEFNAYDAPSTAVQMALPTDQWVTYTMYISLGASATPNALAALRFGCSDYQATVAFYLDDVTFEQSSLPEKLINLDADSDAGMVINNGSDATVTETAPEVGAPAELGSSVYSVTSNSDFQGAWANDEMYLIAGKQYDLSFWFKVADDHPILTTDVEASKYITFFLKTAVGGSTNISTQGTPLVSSLTREPVGGAKVVTQPTEVTAFLLNSAQVKDAGGNAVWQKVTVSFTPTEDTKAFFGVRSNATGTVYMDNIQVTSAENATADVQAAITAVGTAIRTNGLQALRFKTSIDKSAIANLYFGTYELVEYGSVAIKTEYLNGEALVDGAYGAKHSVKGVAYIKGEKNIVFAETDTVIQYTAALTGISEANYTTAYSVRAYAVLARPDGSTFTIYDDETRSKTIYDIATLAYNASGDNDGYAELPGVRAYLKANIIDVVDNWIE